MKVDLSVRQVVNRLTLGDAPGYSNSIHTQSISHWIETQLDPGEDPPDLATKIAALPAVAQGPAQLLADNRLSRDMRMDPEARKQFQQRRRALYRQSVHARLLYGVYSPWQLRELLVDFWFNHFNIFARKGLCSLWVGSFEQQAIRPHVLGRFEDMLMATARHPAMLFYLDNWRNAEPNPKRRHGSGFNENYAREIMELHTVGLHYTQADVIGATHLLSGWGFDRVGEFRFFPRRHDFTPQVILGQRFDGGETGIEAFLRYLANHPDTASHLANEMARYFVADQPPAGLVDAMVTRYRNSGGNLRDMTRAMIEHPEFATHAAKCDKFRTPYRYLMALLRASGRKPERPQPLIGTLVQLGQPLYGCIQPNGWASTQAEWLSADALTARVNFAVALGGGWLPIDSHFRRGESVAMETVADAIDASTLLQHAAAKAPPRLQAAVLLGSPQMQFC